MSRFGLALSAFRRHIGRTIFTVLSVATAFAIFTILGAIEQGMNGNMSLVAVQRLDTFSRVNSSLPQSYAAQVRSVRGVVAVTYLTFFEGYFRDPKNEVPVMAASVPSVLALYPEFLIPDDQKEAFLHDKQGALVGNEIAAQMGWQVGHTVPVQGGPAQQNGSTLWTFHIDGILHTDLPSGFRHAFIVNYDYFNDGLAASPTKDTVNEIDSLVGNPRTWIESPSRSTTNSRMPRRTPAPNPSNRKR